MSDNLEMPLDCAWTKRSSGKALAEKAPPLCEACEVGDECKWIAFDEEFVQSDRWKAVLAGLAEEEGADPSREIRKNLYRSFIRWDLKHGGDREVISMCILEKVRSMYKSKVYMGHTNKRRKKEPFQASDINGEPVEGVWWVFQDGKWVTREIADTTYGKVSLIKN